MHAFQLQLRKPRMAKQRSLVPRPTMLFLLSGLHWLLCIIAKANRRAKNGVGLGTRL